MYKSNGSKKRGGASLLFEEEALPHMKTLFRVAMWLVRDRERAEDLVQQTFTQALESFHRFEPEENCCAWLVAIMYRKNYKWRRLWTRLHLVNDAEEIFAETILFDPPTPPHVTEEQLLSALESLPRKFQEAIVLANIEGMKYKEIADVLHTSVGTVMARLSRGRKQLRAKLAIDARSADNSASIANARAQASLRIVGQGSGRSKNAMP